MSLANQDGRTMQIYEFTSDTWNSSCSCRGFGVLCKLCLCCWWLPPFLIIKKLSLKLY